MALTRRDILKKALSHAVHDLYCFSGNCAMTTPRSGYEEMWQEANAECELLLAWLEELEEKAAPDGHQEAAGA